MMRGTVTSLLAALAILAGASIGAAGGQVRATDREWVAPASAMARSNPLANRSDAAAGGRKLFRQRCATCHGEDGRGSAKGPDLARADVQAQTDGALFWKITGGHSRRGMPAFSFLPELQRWQLVLHVREIGALQAGPR